MLNVLAHAPRRVVPDRRVLAPADILEAAQRAWEEAVDLGARHGVRNAQASVLAPTGTIGLLMDCDTTGIEPDLGLVKFKKLVGGGNMSIVNQTVPRALHKLGYTEDEVDGHRGLHRREQVDRRRAGPQARAPRRSSPARWATTRSTTSVTSR